MKTIILGLILMLSVPVRADLDEHQRKGLDDTKAFMKDAKERNAFIRSDKNATAADQNLEALTGPGANKDEVYGISAEVMEKLTTSAAGDPAKMQEILQQANKDPKAFYDTYFDENAKARVRGVAGQVKSPPASAPR